jgi:HAD superfamily hydrolase (TIGR01509 family)
MHKAVVFDFDGVIVKSEPLHYRTFCEILAPLGIRIDQRRWYRDFAGTGSHNIIGRLLEENGVKADVDALVRSRKELFNAYVRKGGLKPAPGLRRFLSRIRKGGIRTAIASGGHRDNIELILGKIGLLGQFDAIVGGEEAGNRKPHPEIFLRAAERLKLPPGQCVAVEDSIPGAQAAKSAGMALVCFRSPASKFLNNRCSRVIDSFSEFPLELLQGFL